VRVGTGGGVLRFTPWTMVRLGYILSAGSSPYGQYSSRLNAGDGLLERRKDHEIDLATKDLRKLPKVPLGVCLSPYLTLPLRWLLSHYWYEIVLKYTFWTAILYRIFLFERLHKK